MRNADDTVLIAENLTYFTLGTSWALIILSNKLLAFYILSAQKGPNDFIYVEGNYLIFNDLKVYFLLTFLFEE